MKKSLILLVLAASPLLAMAQANALNATGNIGIGTGTGPLTHRINLITTDPALSSLFYMQHNGVANSTMYLGTGGTGHGIPNHVHANLLESHTHFHLSTVGLNNNMYFETGRGTSQAAPVRMMINGLGRIGVGSTAPNAQITINGDSAISMLAMTQKYVHRDSGYLNISNGTGGENQFFPAIIGSGYTPGRTVGIAVVGKVEDIVAASGSNAHLAAVHIQGFSKQNSKLQYANIFTVMNYDVPLMVVKANGSLGLGTANPGTNKLAVEGTIAARKVKVTQTSPWPDFVFRPEFQLPSLDEVAAHIKEKGHLPGIPTEAEVARDGHDLGDMNAKLLQKVEELTLYLLDMKSTNERLQRENESIRQRLEQLEKKK